MNWSDSMATYDVDIHWYCAKSLKGIKASSAREAEAIARQKCQEYNSLDDEHRTRKMMSDGFIACADSSEVAMVRK